MDHFGMSSAPGHEHYGSEHAFHEWERFFEAFECAGVARKLAMAHEQIERNPHFDEMWAEEVLLHLTVPALEARRGRELVAFVERLEQRHPQAFEANAELAFGAGLMATVYERLGPIEPSLEGLLRSLPGYFENVFIGTDIAMYYGFARPLAWAMVDAWPRMRDSDDLFGHALDDYLERTLYACLAAAHQDHTPEQLAHLDWERFRRAEPLSAIFDELVGPETVHRIFLAFLGQPLNPERGVGVGAAAGGVDVLRSDSRAAERAVAVLCAEFGHHLVAAHGWNAARAALALSELNAFLVRYQGEGVVPDVAELYDVLHGGGGVLYRAHALGALVQALGPWLDWLVARELATRDVARSTAAQIQRRLADIDSMMCDFSGDTRLAADVAEALGAMVDDG